MMRETLPIENRNFPVKLYHGTRLRHQNRINELWHEHLELWYLRKGCASASINGVSHTLSEGELCVINPKEVHSFSFQSPSVTYDCIIISPFFLHSGIDPKELIQDENTDNLIFRKPGKEKTLESNTFLLKNYITDPSVVTFLDRIVSEASKKMLGFEIAIRGICCELLVHLYRNHINDTAYFGSISSKHMEKLDPALIYINNHYKEDISYKELSKLCNFSETYFCKLFKNTMQKTVVEYLNILRIQESLTLLEKTNLSVTEIAYQIGFNNLDYFGRIFKKLNQCTPKEYRQRQQSQQ